MVGYFIWSEEVVGSSPTALTCCGLEKKTSHLAHNQEKPVSVTGVRYMETIIVSYPISVAEITSGIEVRKSTPEGYYLHSIKVEQDVIHLVFWKL